MSCGSHTSYIFEIFQRCETIVVAISNFQRVIETMLDELLIDRNIIILIIIRIFDRINFCRFFLHWFFHKFTFFFEYLWIVRMNGILKGVARSMVSKWCRIRAWPVSQLACCLPSHRAYYFLPNVVYIYSREFWIRFDFFLISCKLIFMVNFHECNIL